MGAFQLGHRLLQLLEERSFPPLLELDRFADQTPALAPGHRLTVHGRKDNRAVRRLLAAVSSSADRRRVSVQRRSGAAAARVEIAYDIVPAVAKLLRERELLAGNASVVVAEAIRQAIVDGGLAPGARLKEEELARELGTSRTPIREALLVLQAEGLVDAAPNRGATVRAHDAEDLDDLYQLRALLEGYAARRAAARASEDLVRKLWTSCDRFEKLSDGDVLALVRENLVFHNAILEAAGSARLAGMVRKVIELPLVYKSYIWYSQEQRRISAHYHRQIARAFETRDAERAELVMKEHVFEARDLLVARVRELEDRE